MASFPSNIYDPTNPTSTSPRNNPSLAGEVSGANNEIVAIETALGTNLGNVVTEIVAGSGASVNRGQGVVTISAGSSGSVSAWPTSNGSGSGNLAAETGTGDTTGYSFTDQGTGGFNITTTGSGAVSTAASVGGIMIGSAGGLGVTDISDSGVTVYEEGVGGIYIANFPDGHAGPGVTVQDGSNDGITISSNPGPINVLAGFAGGAGGINLYSESGGTVELHMASGSPATVGMAIVPEGITITNGATSPGIGISAAAGGASVTTTSASVNVVISATGSRSQIIMPTIPTSDPHVVGALYSNLGVLTISAG